ncbi:hypothetical protein [Candidatus Cloacimonas acidaminovorans]|jgi:hypothetical protein|uniref:Uncharacterized protein n=1 Tax=Cloacimonas acidaminovorans (strain Evry) TaxID=459349 RepID=B0VFV4_CLOAI|nr:hypothetical protein [Candidatus Cloacimonas acidaminovorans]CAO81396.1 hypothetical protein; putative membrane protein [Candidatus Cloacimonas acidaminovorans str. Evry]
MKGERLNKAKYYFIKKEVYLILFGYIIMIIIELLMLIGIFLVLRKKFLDIQFNSYLIFLYAFFLWAILNIIIHLFPRKKYSLDIIIRHTQVYLTIIIISLGLISGFSYLISKRPFVPIPDLQGGTFGFSTWNCKASIEDIEINFQYPDSNKIIHLSENQLYDKNLWVSAWNQFTREDSTVIIEKNPNGKTPKIIVDYGGVYFNLPKAGYKANIKNASMTGIIKFYKAEKNLLAYPNFEFSFRVPWDSTGNEPSSKLYIGLQTFFFNPEWSKCYIPLLSLAPSVQHHDSKQLIKKNTRFTKYKFNQPYRLHAVVFDNNAELYIENIQFGAAGTLYEGKFTSKE